MANGVLEILKHESNSFTKQLVKGAYLPGRIVSAVLKPFEAVYQRLVDPLQRKGLPRAAKDGEFHQVRIRSARLVAIQGLLNKSQVNGLVSGDAQLLTKIGLGIGEIRLGRVYLRPRNVTVWLGRYRHLSLVGN